MKKILFVITQNEFGGSQRFLDTLVSHLPKDEYQILIATGKDGDGKFLSHIYKHGFITKKLTHLVRRISPHHDLLAIFEFRNLIKHFQPEVLFLSSSKAGMIGSLAINWPYHLPNLKVIYRIGGWAFNDPQPRWRKKLLIEIEKKTAKYKDVIVVNNKHDFDQAKRLGIKPHGSLELIYNGLDISEIDYLSRQEARLKLGLPENGFVFGTIANFYPTKGLKYLIEAVKQLQETRDMKQVKFVIIGEGELRPKLELLIANYHLQDRVILLGRIDDARSYLKAFEAYVQPSVKEGFPWAILEAMGASLPIIATRVGAIPEVIQDGENGLMVAPSRPDQIADKLVELIANPDLRTTLGSNARETISRVFSLDKMVNQIEQLL